MHIIKVLLCLRFEVRFEVDSYFFNVKVAIPPIKPIYHTVLILTYTLMQNILTSKKISVSLEILLIYAS